MVVHGRRYGRLRRWALSDAITVEVARLWGAVPTLDTASLAVACTTCHTPYVIAKKPNRPNPANQLARAIARWENEGGAPEPASNRPAVLAAKEQHILQCLGAALITQWNELPTNIQRSLFEHAISTEDPLHSIQLKEQIARFLHKHKNDEQG
jgi:hypothetical protein